MHPLIAAWLALNARLDQQPPWTDAAYGVWLDECIVLEQWWAVLRRLPPYVKAKVTVDFA